MIASPSDVAEERRSFREPARVPAIILPIVEPERLFIDIPKQVEGLYAHIGPVMPRFSRVQKFSQPLV